MVQFVDESQNGKIPMNGTPDVLEFTDASFEASKDISLDCDKSEQLKKKMKGVSRKEKLLLKMEKLKKLVEKETQQISNLKKTKEEEVLREKLKVLDTDHDSLCQKEEDIVRRIMEIRINKEQNRKMFEALKKGCKGEPNPDNKTSLNDTKNLNASDIGETKANFTLKNSVMANPIDETTPKEKNKSFLTNNSINIVDTSQSKAQNVKNNEMKHIDDLLCNMKSINSMTFAAMEKDKVSAIDIDQKPAMTDTYHEKGDQATQCLGNDGSNAPEKKKQNGTFVGREIHLGLSPNKMSLLKSKQSLPLNFTEKQDTLKSNGANKTCSQAVLEDRKHCMKVEIAKILVKINERKDDLERCVEKQQFLLAQKIKATITTLEDEKLKLSSILAREDGFEMKEALDQSYNKVQKSDNLYK